MLSVQMMEHAFRGNMKKAVLLSGDKDFRPLVESLVRLGLFVEVVGDQKHISKDLIHSADAHRQLTIDEYFNFSPEAIQQTKPIDFLTLSFFIERAASEGFFQSREGTWQNSSIFLFASNSRTGNWFTTSNKLIHNDSAWVSNDLKKLISYFELKFGQINWK